MNKHKLRFSTSSRDGLTYVNPLPACSSATSWWRDVLAIGRYIDRILCLLRQRRLHGQIPGSR